MPSTFKRRNAIISSSLPNAVFTTGQVIIAPTILNIKQGNEVQLQHIYVASKVSHANVLIVLLRGAPRTTFTVGAAPTLNDHDFDQILFQALINATQVGLTGFFGHLSNININLELGTQDLYAAILAGAGVTYGATDRITSSFGFICD